MKSFSLTLITVTLFLQPQTEDVDSVGLPYLAQLLQVRLADGGLAVMDGVDGFGGVEERRYDKRRVQVVDVSLDG